MAKKAATEKPPKAAKPKKTAEPEAVTITYDLFDLPTAQHKAGLAGLLLQIDHMQGKTPKPKAIPTVVARTTTTATVEFTRESVQCLFDGVYAAEYAVVRVKSNWNAEEVKPSEEVPEEVEEKGLDGEVKKKTVKVRYYFYRQLQPSGSLLRQYITNAPAEWLKLWQAMLWAIPRGNPQSRKPFEEVADGKACKEGADAWADLLKVFKARAKNAFHTGEVAGSLWLGAQAVNAEGVPFEGRAEQTLLLHFWPLVAQVYVPQMVQPDGSSEFVGYVLAIPEVSNLIGFTASYPQLLSGLSGEVRGYRPAEAVIDLPAEGALSFLRHLAQLSHDKATDAETQFDIASVEYLHLAKIGNNIKTLAAGRVSPRPRLLAKYLGIVSKPGERPPYGNPLFPRGLMQALLDDLPWYRPFDKLFAEWDVSFFVPTDAPPKLSWFWADAQKKLHDVMQAMPTDPFPDEPLSDDDILATTVNRLVKRYLDFRLNKEHPEWDFPAFRIARSTPPEAADARRKLAERLFLELRSRRDQAFVDHFTNTVFSVGQYLAQKPVARMFERVAAALFSRSGDVKTLTLMALSANSYVPAKKKETPK